MGDDRQIHPRNGEGRSEARDSLRRAKRGEGVFATTRKTIDLARREGRSGNLPEVLLWRALRTRLGGFKFRRQHPIGPYSLDFAWLSAGVAIEVDGEIHARGDQPAHDETRDAYLEAQGFRMLRIPAREILSDLDAVICGIIFACEVGKPLHQPSAIEASHVPRFDPPHSGELLESKP